MASRQNSNGATFTWDGGNLEVRLARMDADIDRAIAAVMLEYATKGKSYAQQNARWQDRTGAARNGLFARVDRGGQGKYTMTFGHSVPYGIWLEVRFSGRYAIVQPTINYVGPLVMREMGRLFNRM